MKLKDVPIKKISKMQRRILDALDGGDLTPQGIHEKTGILPSTIKTNLWRLHKEGMIHICGWVLTDGWHAVYRGCPGEDEERHMRRPPSMKIINRLRANITDEFNPFRVLLTQVGALE
jgi:transcription initiation factor IIE alpha subunit